MSIDQVLRKPFYDIEPPDQRKEAGGILDKRVLRTLPYSFPEIDFPLPRRSPWPRRPRPRRRRSRTAARAPRARSPRSARRPPPSGR